MKIEQLHHVAIICSDYEKSKYFYTQLLGLAILSEVYREEKDSYKLDLLIGNQYQIELFSFPNPPSRITNPEATGLRHLAFQVQDVEETKNELEKQGINVEEIRIDPVANKKFTFFKDPDDLPIEIYEK